MSRNALRNVIRLIDTVTETVSTEEKFLADLKRSIEMDADSSSRLPSKTYKPSGMNCIRQSFYQLVGKSPDESKSSYTMVGICNSGTDIHVRIQTAISRMREHGMDCEYVNVADFVNTRNLEYLDIVSQNGMETKLYHNKLNMSFMCDGIIKFEGRYYILELKTESSYKFMNRKDVDPAHFNQGTAYSLAFGLNEVLFVYINRDIFDMKAYMFHVTDEMKEHLITYIEECDSYVKRLIAPPKPDDVAKKTCNYCIYRKTCQKDN